MIRPCFCNRCDKNGPYKSGDCRPCWLYHNDPAYRHLWNETFLLRKAIDFWHALLRHIRNYLRRVSRKEKKRRMEICSRCEHYRDGSCAICGCNLKIKTSWQMEKCPLPQHKW